MSCLRQRLRQFLPHSLNIGCQIGGIGMAADGLFRVQRGLHQPFRPQYADRTAQTVESMGGIAQAAFLQRHGLGLNDLDLWELNEAFAAQVLGCLHAWQDDSYCRERLGLPGALGEIEPARLNVDGGAVALGHPVGASGVRIVLHLLQALRRTGGKRGIATICIGGGLGGAMLVEAL